MNNFIENSFIVDLSNAKDTLQIINELSNLLEMSDAKDKNLCLKIRGVELSQAQLLSIRALIQSTGANLAVLDSDTERTILAAQELGITVSKINNNLEITAPETANTKNNVSENINYEEAEQNQTSEEAEQNELSEQTKNIEQVESSLETVENTEKVEMEQTEKVQLPEFMKFEEISENNLEQIKNNSAVEELYPQFGSADDTNIENKNIDNTSSDNYTSEQTASELSYEIFKTEELEDKKNDELPTLYLKQTLRSGQTLCYDGNILVIGDTHPGSELIAKGDITVWGVLGGVAHAGTSGDKNARIRALKLNAIQLRIAGVYAGRSNTENLPFIQRSTEFTPQEARLENDTIVVKSIINEI